MRPTRLLATVAPLVVVPLAAVALAGCAAGKADATSREHSPRVIDASAGPVLVRNVVISPSTSGTGGVQAYLSFTLVSQTTDTLTGASVGSGTVTPTDATAPFTVRPQTPLVISDPETSSTTSPGLAITGLPDPPIVGTTLTVTLAFQNAGTIQVQAPVRDAIS